MCGTKSRNGKNGWLVVLSVALLSLCSPGYLLADVDPPTEKRQKNSIEISSEDWKQQKEDWNQMLLILKNLEDLTEEQKKTIINQDKIIINQDEIIINQDEIIELSNQKLKKLEISQTELSKGIGELKTKTNDLETLNKKITNSNILTAIFVGGVSFGVGVLVPIVIGTVK